MKNRDPSSGPDLRLALSWGVCVYVCLVIVGFVSGFDSLPMVFATRPSPAFLTRVTQTSTFQFQITVQPPTLFGYTGIGLVQNINTHTADSTDDADNTHLDSTNSTSTATATTAAEATPVLTYRLYVVDPDDSTLVTPIPDSCWYQQSNTTVVLDVTHLCSGLSSLLSSSSPSASSASSVTSPSTGLSSPLLVGSCPLPILVPAGSFLFSLGISARNAAREESVVTSMAYQDMKTLASAQGGQVWGAEVQLDPETGAGGGAGTVASMRDTRWIVVLSVLLPVCVVLAVLLLFLLRRRLSQQHNVHLAKVRAAFDDAGPSTARTSGAGAETTTQDTGTDQPNPATSKTFPSIPPSPSVFGTHHIIEMQVPRLRHHAGTGAPQDAQPDS